MRVSVTQVVQWLRRASRELGVPLSASEMRDLAAIPSRESGYQTGAKNFNEATKDRSYGLYQLNTRGSLWSTYAGLGLSDPSQLWDGYTNVKAAVYLVKLNRQYHGAAGGLWPWGPYKGMAPTYNVSANALAAASVAVGTPGGSGQEGGLVGGGSLNVGQPVSGGNNPIDRMLAWAMGHALGKPYKYATTGPESYDCSGLVTAMYRQIGISLPAYTRAAVKMGRHVNLQDIRPGDAVYFDGAVPPFGHVGIYLGNGLYIQAPRTGDVVKISTLNMASVREVRRYVADSVANEARPNNGTVTDMSDTGPTINTAPGVDPGANPSNGLENADDETVRQYIRDNFGWMAGFLDDPEMGPLLMQAARENWSPQRIDGAVKKTDWWQKRSASQRQWDQLLHDDPGEAGKQIGERSRDIVDIAGQLGVTLSATQINELAQESLRSGWTNDQLRDTIIGNVKWDADPTTTQGQLQASAADLKALSKQYGMLLDSAQAQTWAMSLAQGKTSMEGITQTLKDWAKAAFPYIDTNSISVDDYFAPAKSVIAQELEVPSTSIDITDPQWMSLLQLRDETGKVRGATLNEARLKARSDPRWVKTKSATDEGTDAANSVLKALTGTSMGGLGG